MSTNIKNTLSDIIKDETIDTNCPNCDNSISFTIKQIGSSIICPHCKETIELKDNNFTESINDLDKQINKMFK